MIGTILVILLILVLVVYCIVVTIGMIRGMKKTEHYERAFDDIKAMANAAYEQMKEVDTLGAFEADDDVGQTFDEIKRLVDELNNYITENINA